jgi:hypothetical protein
MGGIGAMAGLVGVGVDADGPVVGGMTDTMARWDTGSRIQGLLFAGVGTAIDAIGAGQSEGCGP